MDQMTSNIGITPTLKVFTCPYNVLGDHTACLEGMPHQLGIPFAACRAWHWHDGYCVRVGREVCR